MDHFSYKEDGTLYAENVPILKIAQEVGTPFYCYSTATLKRHYQVLASAFENRKVSICYAVKANSNIAVLKTLAELGSGADTVSEGEIRRALKAGIKPEKIVFSGVGKTKNEMLFALKEGIGQFNVESFEELEILNDIAANIEVKAPVAIRVNPDIDAGTHQKITTGRKQDKFGIAWNKAKEAYKRAAELSNLEIVGVATHIGSQITNLDPMRRAFAQLAGLVKDLKSEGYSIYKLDLGGGLGIPYQENKESPPLPPEYAEMIFEISEGLDVELELEPGRLIAGNAGIVVSEVILLKNTPDRKFLVIDAAMNDFIRPSFYEAHHDIISVHKEAGSNVKMDIVGPICESSDIFARQRNMPLNLESGDLVAIRSAGAYGAVMSSTYNSRLLIPEVMVNGDEYCVIRQRQTYEQLLEQDVLPSWLNK